MKCLNRENLNAYQIAKALKKKYSTIFDRLGDLEAKGIVKRVATVTASKSHQKIPLYGLSDLGLCVAIFHSSNPQLKQSALNTFGERFSKAWQTFSDLYDFDPKQSVLLGQWIKSDEGIRAILQHFGDYGISDNETSYSENQILLRFRRMIDHAIGLELSGVATTKSVPSVWGAVAISGPQPQIRSFEDALINLANIAYHHPKLRKLYNAVKAADGPLLERIHGPMRKGGGPPHFEQKNPSPLRRRVSDEA